MASPTPSILWLASRSLHERGTQHCAMARYIENHAGPYGYGFQRRALSLPLVTGTYVDKPISAICQWIIDAAATTGQQLPNAPEDVIRWAANLAVEKYRAVVAKRGILALAADDAEAKARLNNLIAEQVTLIEGLVWVFVLFRLPQILADEVLLQVQQEESYVLGCTCGLGDGLGEISDHEARGCQGIGELSLPDLITARKSDGGYLYRELKTASQAKRSWNESWERKLQFIMGILGTERRLGKEFSGFAVEGIIKGARKRDYGADQSAPKKQQSWICYGYLSMGTGLIAADWKPSYNYFDQEGIKHTVSKQYHKTALWEAPDDSFPGKPEGMSRVEWWVRYVANNFPQSLAQCINTIGPIPKQRYMLDKALRSVAAEENTWKERVWKVYDFSVRTGKVWGDPEFHEFLETVIPRSWNCDPFGPDHPCSCQPLCFEHEGWDKPIESGLFVYRSPHHALEAQQMKARGLEPEEGVGYEPDEDDDGDWE